MQFEVLEQNSFNPDRVQISLLTSVTSYFNLRYLNTRLRSPLPLHAQLFTSQANLHGLKKDHLSFKNTMHGSFISWLRTDQHQDKTLFEHNNLRSWNAYLRILYEWFKIV